MKHSARSLDFLSRLHDGEISPEERARFEAHRAHCDECRRSVAEYEASLASFRGARASGPPPDLAARILRRLEASNRRRRSPFGVVFGIDVRWAGALTAALVAVIFGYSLLDRQREMRRIPVSFVEARPTPLAAAVETATTPRSLDAPSRVPAAPPAATSRGATALKDAGAAPIAAALEKAPSSKPLDAEAKIASPAAAAPAPLAARRAFAKEREAGDGTSPSDERAPDTKSKAPREELDAISAGAGASSGAEPASSMRVRVTALDGFGAPPSLVGDSAGALRDDDRGRYVVVVSAAGIPISAEREIATRQEMAAGPHAAPDRFGPLRRLRFAAGDRPRRLLVQVDAEPSR